MIIVRLFQLFLLCTTTNKVVSQSLMMDYHIVHEKAFRPSFPDSLLATYQGTASFQNFIDCAHLGVRLTGCCTAVFETNIKSCKMFSENPGYSGSLVTNSTGVFTTMINERLPSKLFLIHVIQIDHGRARLFLM